MSDIGAAGRARILVCITCRAATLPSDTLRADAPDADALRSGLALAEALRTVRYGGAVAASGLTGGHELATTVYPFIVRAVSLLGIDTVATPIEERRDLWRAMAEEFPLARCDEMVSEEIGLGALSEALNRVLNGQVRGRVLVAPLR